MGARRHDYRRRVFDTCLGKLNLKMLRVKPTGGKFTSSHKWGFFEKNAIN